MIDAIKQGDEFAFEQSYVEHRQKVFAYLFKKTNSTEDARDLMQTVFLKLWKYRKSLSTEYLLEQQLFHIARTVFIDHLRATTKKNKTVEKIAAASSADPSYAYISTAFDLRTRMNDVVSGMPEIRQKVFQLSRLEGYTYQEIAKELSISIKSVDNNLTKALRQLRKLVLAIATLISAAACI
jgi:RNA polymerase sigma-70 factor (ECF subfamily)